MEGERIKNGARPCDEDLGIAAVEPIERPPVPVDVRMDCGVLEPIEFQNPVGVRMLERCSFGDDCRL